MLPKIDLRFKTLQHLNLSVNYLTTKFFRNIFQRKLERIFMFNNSLKKESLKKLEESQNTYNKNVAVVKNKSVELYEIRKAGSFKIISAVENYINTLSSSPKEFNKSFSEYKAEFKVFNDMLFILNKESNKSDIKATSTAGSGVLTGIGVAALGPSAAMAVATTFGTASTGTAIASLSGAAATKAALAWLGGGALAAGGGGVAAGNALLALAGPIGWAIGGVGILGGGLLARSKNKEIAERANEERKKIEVGIRSLNAAIYEIKSLISQTNTHSNGVENLLSILQSQAPNDYKLFTPEDKEKLAALINHIQSLSKLLNKKVQ